MMMQTYDELEAMRVIWLQEAKDKKVFDDLEDIAWALGAPIVNKAAGRTGRWFTDGDIALYVYIDIGPWVGTGYAELTIFSVHVGANQTVYYRSSNIDIAEDPKDPFYFVPGKWVDTLLKHASEAKRILGKAEHEKIDERARWLSALLLIGKDI
jgi:hypothetical protein